MTIWVRTPSWDKKLSSPRLYEKFIRHKSGFQLESELEARTLPCTVGAKFMVGATNASTA
jgi:hypothetical protein